MLIELSMIERISIPFRRIVVVPLSFIGCYVKSDSLPIYSKVTCNSLTAPSNFYTSKWKQLSISMHIILLVWLHQYTQTDQPVSLFLKLTWHTYFLTPFHEQMWSCSVTSSMCKYDPFTPLKMSAVDFVTCPETSVERYSYYASEYLS